MPCSFLPAPRRIQCWGDLRAVSVRDKGGAEGSGELSWQDGPSWVMPCPLTFCRDDCYCSSCAGPLHSGATTQVWPWDLVSCGLLLDVGRICSNMLKGHFSERFFSSLSDIKPVCAFPNAVAADLVPWEQARRVVSFCMSGCVSTRGRSVRFPQCL